jgi:hypothetical protein
LVGSLFHAGPGSKRFALYQTPFPFIERPAIAQQLLFMTTYNLDAALNCALGLLFVLYGYDTFLDVRFAMVIDQIFSAKSDFTPKLVKNSHFYAPKNQPSRLKK